MALTGYWPMQRRDPQRTNYNTNNVFTLPSAEAYIITDYASSVVPRSYDLVMDDEGNVYWAFGNNVMGFSPDLTPLWGPVSAGGRLFLVGRYTLLSAYTDTVYFIDTRTGEVLYTRTLEGDYASPRVVNGDKMVGVGAGGTDYVKYVCCWELDGSLKWVRDVKNLPSGGYSYWDIISGPSLSPFGNVLVGVRDLWSADKGGVLCFDGSSGDLLWKYVPGTTGGMDIYLVGHDGTIFTSGPRYGGNEEVAAISGDGTFKWITNFGTPGCWKYAAALGYEGLFISRYDEGLLTILDPATGAEICTLSMPFFNWLGDLISAGPGYFITYTYDGDEDVVSACDSSSGDVIWSCRYESAPTNPGGGIVGPNGRVYMADGAWRIFVIGSPMSEAFTDCAQFLSDARTNGRVTLL